MCSSDLRRFSSSHPHPAPLAARFLRALHPLRQHIAPFPTFFFFFPSEAFYLAGLAGPDNPSSLGFIIPALQRLQTAPTPAPTDAPPVADPYAPAATSAPSPAPTGALIWPELPAAARFTLLNVVFGKRCRGWACAAAGISNATRVLLSVTVPAQWQLAVVAARLADVVQVGVSFHISNAKTSVEPLTTASTPAPTACLLACLPACLPACLLACLPACLPVYPLQRGLLAAALTYDVGYNVTVPVGGLTLTAPLPTVQVRLWPAWKCV